MMLVENLKEALHSLLGAKQRTLLALLGIVIGIGSVIAMVSVGTIVQNEALRQFKEMGTDILTIRQAYSGSGGRGDISSSSEGFELHQSMALPQKTEAVSMVTVQASVYEQLKYRTTRESLPALGVTESAFSLFKLEMAEGRFISDLDQNIFFCVLSAGAKNRLKKAGMREPVGKNIVFNNRFFTIIGVLETLPINSMRPYEINEGIIIPISTAMRFPKRPTITGLTARMRPGISTDEATREIASYFKTVARSQVEIRSAEELIEQMKKQMRMFTLLLGAIGSISLIVGGVGVMNVMLVSVSERKKEIGIRRAIGARQSDIQTQFLIESLVLCSVGGVLGISVGIGASWLIAHFSNWQFIFSMASVFLGGGVSVAVGIFFGFYPARQAAKLSPIEALRAE
jgi:putative ABC transport system permease protein